MATHSAADWNSRSLAHFVLRAATRKWRLPEIKLGLIPAYGGTQRLPRMIGESRALEMILSGRNVDAAEAERIGLINRLVDGDLLAAGIEFARSFSGQSLATSWSGAPSGASGTRRVAGTRV